MRSETRFFSTTAVERHAGLSRARSRARRRGQSLIEFAFLMPILLGMVLIQRDVQTAVSASIVNQQYARATMHFLFFNQAWYPEEQFTEMQSRNALMRRWWVGVEDERQPDESVDKPPTAPVIKVGMVPSKHDDDRGVEVESRQKVRIRAEAFVCLPMRGVKLDSPYAFFSNMPEEAFLPGKVTYCSD